MTTVTAEGYRDLPRARTVLGLLQGELAMLRQLQTNFPKTFATKVDLVNRLAAIPEELRKVEAKIVVLERSPVAPVPLTTAPAPRASPVVPVVPLTPALAPKAVPTPPEAPAPTVDAQRAALLDAAVLGTVLNATIDNTTTNPFTISIPGNRASYRVTAKPNGKVDIQLTQWAGAAITKPAVEIAPTAVANHIRADIARRTAPPVVPAPAERVPAGMLTADQIDQRIAALPATVRDYVKDAYRQLLGKGDLVEGAAPRTERNMDGTDVRFMLKGGTIYYVQRFAVNRANPIPKIWYTFQEDKVYLSFPTDGAPERGTLEEVEDQNPRAMNIEDHIYKRKSGETYDCHGKKLS